MMTAAVTFGRSTTTLLLSMGVMTMKMISSTSITSTMGVTLMLELTFLPSSLFTIAILYSVDRASLQLHGEDSAPGAKPGQPTLLPMRDSRCLLYGRALRPGQKQLPLALLDEVVDQFARRVVHLDVKGFNLVGEVVEGHNGGGGHPRPARRQ